MPSREGYTDFAVRLESTDARTMPGPRIDHNERPADWIHGDILRRDDPNKGVVDRSLERSSVEHEFRGEAENMGSLERHMLVVLVAALAHDVPEQDAALHGIDCAFDRCGEWAKYRYC